MSDFGEWIKEITPGGVGIWTLVAAVLVALIRQGPINRKLANEREGNLLRERSVEMAGMRVKIVELEAAVRIANHRADNLEMILDGLLDMMELAPEKAAEAVKRARVARERGRAAIAQEKGAAMAATIKAAHTEGEGE